jgi:hypothetical protein
MGDGGCGFGFGLIAFGAVPRRLVGCRIDLIERLACFDITSFNKVTLQDDTAHLGRTSATRKAEVRPGSSVVTDSGALFTTWTVTCGAWAWGCGLSELSQPVSNKAEIIKPDKSVTLA